MIKKNKDSKGRVLKPDNCPFVLCVGSKRLINKEKFEEYLDNQIKFKH